MSDSTQHEPGVEAGGGPARVPSPRQADYVHEFLMCWWAHRVQIAVTLVAAAVLFSGLILLVQKKYRAEATIILLPPRFSSEVRAEPLSVPAAKTLMSSGELAQQIVVHLRGGHEVLAGLRGDALDTFHLQLQASRSSRGSELGPLIAGVPENLRLYLERLQPDELRTLRDYPEGQLADLAVEDLAKALSSEDIVEKRTAAEIKLSPLIRLFAISDSGPRAQLLANTWAILFERKYAEVTSDKTRRQFESIAALQESSQKELKDIQDEIIAFRRLHNLELYLKTIDELSVNYREFTNQLVRKENALRAERLRLAELERIAAATEAGGDWIGRIDAGGGNDSGGEPIRIEMIADGLTTASRNLYEQVRARAVQSREGLESALQQSQRFYEANSIKALTSERTALETDLSAQQQRLRNGQVRILVLRNTLASLDRMLSESQQVIRLQKEIPDESIATAIAAGGRSADLRALSNLSFEREELSAPYMSLLGQRLTLEAEYEQTVNEVRELATATATSRASLDTLDQRLADARMRENLVSDNLQRWREANSALYQSFIDTGQQIHNSAKDIGLLEQEVDRLGSATSETSASIGLYQSLYNESSAELQRLELRLRAIQRNADLLLQKQQEAQIAVNEDVSDVSVAAAAVAPMRHFFPQRSVTVAALLLLTMLVLLGGLARRRYVELRQAG